jgi:type IV pilus assembly protein PilA
MRAWKRSLNRGFTLVELMIVVAIIGVLAALAIYGVTKYLASAKTSEAKNTLGNLSRAGASAFERETTESELVAEGGSSTNSSHVFCDSTLAVPAAPPKGTKYQPDSKDNVDFETDEWKCLKFSVNQAIYYSYKYTKGGTWAGTVDPTADGFEAGAQGDINGDGVAFSKFARVGTKNAGDQATVRLSTQLEIIDENE